MVTCLPSAILIFNTTTAHVQTCWPILHCKEKEIGLQSMHEKKVAKTETGSLTSQVSVLPRSWGERQESGESGEKGYVKMKAVWTTKVQIKSHKNNSHLHQIYKIHLVQDQKILHVPVEIKKHPRETIFSCPNKRVDHPNSRQKKWFAPPHPLLYLIATSPIYNKELCHVS